MILSQEESIKFIEICKRCKWDVSYYTKLIKHQTTDYYIIIPMQYYDDVAEIIEPEFMLSGYVLMKKTHISRELHMKLRPIHTTIETLETHINGPRGRYDDVRSLQIQDPKLLIAYAEYLFKYNKMDFDPNWYKDLLI